jgi:hypothetical protein
LAAWLGWCAYLPSQLTVLLIQAFASTLPTHSSVQTKLLFSDTPGARRAANMSLLALPFRPFAVSAGHALVMQAEFARQATQHKAVRVDLRRHYTAALLGVAAFFGEDLITDSGYAGFVHSGQCESKPCRAWLCVQQLCRVSVCSNSQPAALFIVRAFSALSCCRSGRLLPSCDT